MEVAVVGLGAVGMLIAHFLNAAGVRPKAVVKTPCSRYEFCAHGMCEALEVELAERAAASGYAVVAVKAYDTEAALERTAGRLLVVQNGIGGVEAARARGFEAYAGVLTYGVYREGCRGELRGEGRLYMPAELADLAELLERGGMRVEVLKDVEPVRWMKLAVNAAINPVTAILDAPNGVVLENAWARRLAERLAEEAGLVAEARGVRLPGDPVREALRVAEATRYNVSSMAQDLRRGARTEVDYINGAVASAGRELGVPTPYNEAVYLAVKALEAVARSSSRRA